MAKEYRTIRNDVALPYQWALGRTWTRFFDGLKEERILGTKCDRCGKVYVPARSFCPVCFTDLMEWVDVKPRGRLVSWTVVNTSYHGQVKEPPYIVALIRLDGADCDFHHFIDGFNITDAGERKRKLRAGAKVKAVWSPSKNADIRDIAWFAPV
ncbi:MAG: hypothetical protein CVU61_13900 [Deltaproteobacteria bacterium HGW-Deltaproteobacteria-19]|jgi:hypothetical protein|nr:MAG: hypothetical protein CVU61_13900 [Deltaproteobacteria bacterium HGW-Deltaproteobacteria-19]